MSPHYWWLLVKCKSPNFLNYFLWGTNGLLNRAIMHCFHFFLIAYSLAKYWPSGVSSLFPLLHVQKSSEYSLILRLMASSWDITILYSYSHLQQPIFLTTCNECLFTCFVDTSSCIYYKSGSQNIDHTSSGITLRGCGL